MARYPRVKNPDVEEIYHVSTQENNEDYIFDAKDEKKIPNILLFLDIFERAKKKYQFKVFAFSIMSTHIHILIRPNHKFGDISAVMRYINGRFSFEFNKLHDKKGGHNWKERFSSKIVRGKKYLRNVMRYILLNPVRAGMVEDPMDYLYHFGHTIMNSDQPEPAFGNLVDLDAIPADVIAYLQALIRKIKKSIAQCAQKTAAALLKALRYKNPIFSFNLSKRPREQIYRYFSGAKNVVRQLRELYHLKNYRGKGL